MLQPLYAALINKKDFQFSVSYKALLYKMYCQGIKWKLQPKNSVPIPELVADGMLKVGPILRIISRFSSFHFAGPRPKHIQDGIGCSFIDQTMVFDL